MKRLLLPVLIACLAAALAAAESPQDRPKNWAEPQKLDGVPNLHKVSDSLYRSAQPTSVGMQNLKAKGIRTIVNLRSFQSDRTELGATGLGYEHITMKAWHPERKEVVRFLKIATDPKQGPVLVHCLHGADRTGTMCAVYRIAVLNWSREEALKEMTTGDFGYHKVFSGLPKWIEGLDIEAIRTEVGIKISPTTP